MRSEPPEVVATLAGRTVVARDLLWIVARDRSSGADVSVGFYSDVGNIEASVRSPVAGVVTRAFYGSGTLIEISAISMNVGINTNPLTIKMSQISDLVQQAVRDYDVKQAIVEVYRMYLDPVTRLAVAPASCLWMGFVDEIDITTPAEGDVGDVVLKCASHTQDMYRSNPDTRSHESQQVRYPGDDFYIDTEVVGEWEHFWGKTQGKIPTRAPGLFGWNNFLGFL